VEFDQFTVALLLLSPTSPDFTEAELDRLQDAHLAHLADLQQAGHLLAAGPLIGPADRTYRGVTIFRVDPERAQELCDQDPMVIAGRFEVQIQPWMVPAGAVSFGPARFPRSVSDAEA
jgi:uncharacterized protein